jgi:hypothetical protein
MKVEVLGLEEMKEESGIKPGNISSLLGDLSVIHVQNISPVMGSAAIRMQGLDGSTPNCCAMDCLCTTASVVILVFYLFTARF